VTAWGYSWGNSWGNSWGLNRVEDAARSGYWRLFYYNLQAKANEERFAREAIVVGTKPVLITKKLVRKRNILEKKIATKSSKVRHIEVKRIVPGLLDDQLAILETLPEVPWDAINEFMFKIQFTSVAQCGILKTSEQGYRQHSEELLLLLAV